tara:strand:- start:4434 stop:5471 length:1038 start_codon:yes stop_codon:yes gene_type:complete
MHNPADVSGALSAMIKRTGVPALAAAAIHQGKIVSVGSTGTRKKGEAARVTHDDRFHIGSCTKSMTATLGAILIDKGRLRWETGVAEVFPRNEVNTAYRGATFEHLVSNTAGAPGDIEPSLWTSLWERNGTKREQRRMLVREILRRPPAYEPGTDQVYSNAGFSIAGAMLETLMDKSYEQLLSENLLDPLEMSSAGFRAPASHGLIDQPYGHKESFFRITPVDPEPHGDNPPAIAPAGAVHCSVMDFAKYAQFHLRRNQMLSEESWKRLHESAAHRDYGHGWILVKRDWAHGTALTHSGSNTMFFSTIWIAPERDFAAVSMCNLGGRKGLKKCDQAIHYLINKHL